MYTLKGRGDADGLVARFNRAEASLERLAQSVAEISEILRGQNDSMGLIGKINVLWRSWVFLVGLFGGAVGFFVRAQRN